jgi:hypothetical protein
MGLKGDPKRLTTFAKQLRALPITLAAAVATEAAPALTGLTHGAFTGGQTVYGDARPRGVDGQPLKLYKSGATESGLRFVSVGTIVRCVLPNKYQRYLIRYGILPNGGMPVAWRAKLAEIVRAQEAPEL